MMREWYEQQLGLWVKKRECVEAATVLQRIAGDFLLQMGGTPDLAHSAQSRSFYRYVLLDDLIPGTHGICGDLNNLPVQLSSVDVVLLIHVLEFVPHPVKLIKNIYESLKPGGHILVFGFNPWSLAGISRIFHSKKEMPWKGKFWSRAQIKQWLNRSDFTIQMSKTFCFHWWSHQAPTPKMTLFTETMGHLSMLNAGSIYMIAAQKRTYDPIKPALFWKKNLLMRKPVSSTPRV